MQYYFAIIKYYIALSAGGRAIHESFNPFFPCLPFRNVSLLRPAARRAPRTPTPNSTVTAPPPRRSTSNPATIVSGRPNCPTGFSSGGCARRTRRSRTAQPRTRAPLRRGVAAPYPVGSLHDGLLRALRARQRDGVVPLRRPCGRAGRCRGRGGGAVGRRCRLPCAGVRLHRRIRLFSTVVFSPRHSPNKFGSALGLSKRFVFNSRFLATA